MTVESVLTFHLVKVSFCWLLLYSVYVVWWPRCSWRIPCLHLPTSVGRSTGNKDARYMLSFEFWGFELRSLCMCRGYLLKYLPVPSSLFYELMTTLLSWGVLYLPGILQQDSIHTVPHLCVTFFREEIITCLIPLDDVRIWSCFISKALKEKWDAGTQERRNPGTKVELIACHRAQGFENGRAKWKSFSAMSLLSFLFLNSLTFSLLFSLFPPGHCIKCSSLVFHFTSCPNITLYNN